MKEKRLHKWNIFYHHWQDILAFLGGIFLMGTVAFQISSLEAYTGWIAFLAGALITLMMAASMQNNEPIYSWLAAGAGTVVALSSFLPVIFGVELSFWSLLIGGGVVAFTQVWSGALKRREEHVPRGVTEAGRPVRA